MPNRIIKESICTSDEIDQLSAEQEVFFYRLMVVVDDFGLIDARLPILKSKCYPLKSIDINSIQDNLAHLVAVGLVKLYRAEGKPYLSITNWAKHQQIRAQRAKCPMPEDGAAITCNQLISDAPVIQSNPIQSESNPNPIPAPKAARFDPMDLPMPLGLKAAKWEEWVVYRSKVGKKPKQETWMKQIEFLAGCIAKGIDPAGLIDESIRNGWQGLFEPKARASPYESEKDRSRRETYEAMTGKKHEPANERIIDAFAERVD